MDGDGDMDIVAALGDDDTFAWYENDGNADPSWTAANIQTGVDSAFSVFAEDMDGDAYMDIVSASYTDNTTFGMRMTVTQILLGQPQRFQSAFRGPYETL